MIILIYIILYTIVLLLSYNKFRRIINITSIFTTVWMFSGALSCLGLFGLRIPSFTVHLYAWMFVLTVNAIFLSFATTRNCAKEYADNDSNRNREEYLRVKRYHSRAKYIQIISIVLIIPLMIKTVSMYMAFDGLAAIRISYFSGTNFDSVFKDLFFRIIPVGFLNALIIYYSFYSFEVKRYKYLIYALLNAILVTMMNGGRFTLMLLLYTVILLWVSGEIHFDKRSFGKNYKRRIKLIITVIVSVMGIITLSRGQTVLKNIYMYFSGSLSFLDYIIDNPAQFALDQPLHGYLTLGAILEPIVLLLKVVGLTSAKVPSYEFNIYGQNYHNIGAGSDMILFNANTTVLYYFLRDFGTLGILIGALFVGVLAVFTYNRWRCGSRFWGLVFIFVGNAMFNSLMTYQLFGSTPFFIAVAFYLLSQRKFVIGRKSYRV